MTQPSPTAFSKYTIFAKNTDFLQKNKNSDMIQIKRTLVLKGIFPETEYMCTYVPNFKFLA